MRTPSLSVSLSFLVACAALLGACGEKVVAKAEIEQQAMKMLTASVGQQAPQITCPGDLKAKPGTVMTCSIQLDGKSHDVKISVTGIEGGNATFDVEVAKEPRA